METFLGIVVADLFVALSEMLDQAKEGAFGLVAHLLGWFALFLL